MAYNDYYKSLIQNSAMGANTGMSPVQSALGEYGQSSGWDNPFQMNYGNDWTSPGSLGSQGFFVPSGQGQGFNPNQPYGTTGQAGPVNSALQQYYQTPGMQMGPGGQPISQFAGQGGLTSNTGNQLALMQAQYGLQQQAQQAKMASAQAAAKQLGLDPSVASSMAEQMASVKDLSTQRESDAAMQAVRNQLARGGMGISSEGDKLMADVLGTTAAQDRSNRTMAEIQMRQWMTQMLSQMLGRGI